MRGAPAGQSVGVAFGVTPPHDEHSALPVVHGFELREPILQNDAAPRLAYQRNVRSYPALMRPAEVLFARELVVETTQDRRRSQAPAGARR